MDIPKLLIADPSPEFCSGLGKLLGDDFVLRICHNGQEAKALLRCFCPDVILIDLMLPGLDGLSVLGSLRGMARRPAVVATTCYSSPYIENEIGSLGVALLMLKPCSLEALADHIRHLSCKGEPAVLPLRDPPRTAEDALRAMGFMRKWKGFHFLEDAATLYGGDPGQSVTKELYPAVAKLHGTNAATVERAIRIAIHSAWLNRDEKVWQRYLPTEAAGRPTNTAFITALAALEEREAYAV